MLKFLGHHSAELPSTHHKLQHLSICLLSYTLKMYFVSLPLLAIEFVQFDSLFGSTTNGAGAVSTSAFHGVLDSYLPNIWSSPEI